MPDLVIFSDESGSNGPRYSNFFGGALVRGADLDEITDAINESKRSVNLFGEIKWTKVSSQYLEKYAVVVNRFFDFVREDRIKVRIMFTDNRFRAHSREHRDTRYTKLYYQFIKHSFGLGYCDEPEGPMRLLLRPDQLPVSHEKRLMFKEYLAALSKHPDFRERRLTVPLEEIRETRSHDEVVLQLLDINLGAMWFRLNNFQLARPEGATRRSAKTLAKEKLYTLISRRIREIRPGFNIGITTGKKHAADYWKQSYRHWKFLAYGSELLRPEER